MFKLNPIYKKNYYINNRIIRFFIKLKNKLKNKLKKYNSNSSLIPNRYNNKISKIDVSELCLQSYPCQHVCTFYYIDGTTKTIKTNGREIAYNYFDNLSEIDKEHFIEYLPKTV